MKPRMSHLMIGSLTLALIAGSFAGLLGYRKFVSTNQRIPLRVIFEGSASGLHKGGSVNFGGIRVGEVVSLKLDNPRRVVALAMIDNTAPIRKDTLAGLEFQGLTGVAALSLIGGSPEAPPVPLDADGVPILVADPDATQDVETRIKAALRNVDKVIADNQAELKETLLNLETFSASLAANGEKIDSVVRRAETGVGAVDLVCQNRRLVDRRRQHRFRRIAPHRAIDPRTGPELQQEVRGLHGRQPQDVRRHQRVGEQGRRAAAVGCVPRTQRSAGGSGALQSRGRNKARRSWRSRLCGAA